MNAAKVGFQPYTVSVEYFDGEYSRINNTRTCYVEVIDSRNSLVFISSAPHPDIAALRSAAGTNENYQTTHLTPQELVAKKLKADLIVWHGPNFPADNEAYTYIKQQKLPVLFVIPSAFSNASLSELNLFSLNNQRGQSDEIQGKFNQGFNTFQLSEDTKNAIDFFPPLVAKFGVINPKGNYETLVFQKVGNTVKKEPLLYLNKQYQLAHGLIYGEGVWRWRLSDYMKSKTHDHFNELFLKIFAYLTVKREGMGLSVQFDKRINNSFAKDYVGIGNPEEAGYLKGYIDANKRVVETIQAISIWQQKEFRQSGVKPEFWEHESWDKFNEERKVRNEYARGITGAYEEFADLITQTGMNYATILRQAENRDDTKYIVHNVNTQLHIESTNYADLVNGILKSDQELTQKSYNNLKLEIAENYGRIQECCLELGELKEDEQDIIS